MRAKINLDRAQTQNQASTFSALTSIGVANM